MNEAGDRSKYFKFKALLQRDKWLRPAYVGVDERGWINYLSTQPPKDVLAMDAVDGFALPGFQNAHSHAFQYAMAGLAENHPVGTHDDFWTWREAMYQCALAVDPDQAQAIAAMLYAEMLRHGYTHVAEFHYLHHDKEGKPYDSLAEMGERMVAAASEAGIKITLIPVFYQKGTFGQAPQPRQRRFISNTVEAYIKLLEASGKITDRYAHANLGVSVHSLRAVELEDIVTTFKIAPPDLPFHLHVAEQQKEVDDCQAYCGKRPMQWVLDNLPVDGHFHLVHCTHLNDQELGRLAKSGGQVVLCPSTEGNLGDGIFRMKEYVELGGRWSIGTDSHVGINPLEEFRMMDYRQRLLSHVRNTFPGDGAAYLIGESVQSGRKAMGVNNLDNFNLGSPFDAVIFDGQSPLLEATSPTHLASAMVYSSDTHHCLGTLVNGRWIVKRNRHEKEEQIKPAFLKALHQMKTR